MRTKGTLNQATLDKIKRFLSGDTDVARPPVKVLRIYEENYASKNLASIQDDQSNNTSELESAIDMTFKPEQTRLNNTQRANPADDVIHEEDSMDPMSKIIRERRDKQEREGDLDENHEQIFADTMNDVLSHWEDNTSEKEPRKSVETFSELKESVQVISPAVMSASMTALSTALQGSTKADVAFDIPSVEKEAKKRKSETHISRIEERVDRLVKERIQVVENITSRPESSQHVKHSHYGLPGWTEFILSQLTKTEKIVDKDGNIRPKAMGLRRLIEEHVGPIVDVASNIVCAPSRENCGLHGVQAIVTIKVTNPDHPANGERITWSDMSSVFASMNGQPDIVTLNPLASAYTMAQGRCYRSLLNLSGVYTSEEMADKGRPTPRRHDPDREIDISQGNQPISDKQCRMIENLTSIYKKNPLLIVKEVLGIEVNSLDELTFEDGKKIQSHVNELQYKSQD